MANAQELITKLMKTIGNEKKGLRVLHTNVTDIPGFGTDLAEVVLSHQNPFLGRSLSECLSEFNENYRVAIISTRSAHRNTTTGSAVAAAAMAAAMNRATRTGGSSKSPRSSSKSPRSRAHSKDYEEDLNSPAVRLAQINIDSADNGLNEVDLEGQLEESVADPMIPRGPDSRSMTLSTGDVLLCLTKDKDIKDLLTNKDFYVVSLVGSVPKPLTPYGTIPIIIFTIMIIVVAVGWVNVCPAALTVSAIFFAGGWIKSSEISKLVDVRLLMLMGCALSFAKSVDHSGLATSIASVVNAAQAGKTGSLFIVYILTSIMTSLVSNNAAAALMYPFAVAVAKGLNVSFIPFAYAVMIAATAAFMSPIGYQTHLMVWGPGGYSFLDFVKFGSVPSVIFCLCTCLLAPLFYPF